MRRLGVLFGLLFLMGVVFGATVSLNYGDYESRTYELNDNMLLNVVITNIDKNVHGIYVSLDPDLEGHVFCAPGLVTDRSGEPWDAEFSCILLKGSYEGTIYFKPRDYDVDANTGEPVGEVVTTRLSLTVTEKQVWYTNYAYTGIGGTITVGPYTVVVEDSDVVSADITVQKGSATIFAGVVFVGQELEISDDFHLTFNGYSEKRGMAFFTIKTRFPVSVSSSAKEYYLAVSPVVYADESNKARVEIYTNCPKVSVCDQNGDCKDLTVPDSGKLSLVSSLGSYTVKCKGSDLERTFEVDPPLVITKVVTKTVEKKENPDEVCPSWFFSLPDYKKTSLCGGISRTQSGGSTASPSPDWRIIALVVLVGLGAWYYFKKRGKKGFEEPEKEIEAVPEMEG